MVVLLTVVLGLPRFGRHTPDSRRYLAVAKYFRGEAARATLSRTFASRPLVPFLAARLPPANLNFNFAVINIAATALAYLLFIPYLKRFVTSSTELNVGMLLLVVSIPTPNYGSSVLSDPVGFLFLVIAVTFLLKEQYLRMTAVICLGVLARESLLTVTLAAVIDLMLGARSRGSQRWRRVLTVLPLVTVPPIAVFLGVRAHFSDLPALFWWAPSLSGFIRNVSQPKQGWITFVLTLGPPLVLCVAGFRQRGMRGLKTLGEREARLLLSLVLVSVAYIVYSNVIRTAYMSGRFVWPFYAALIPIAVRMGNETRLFTKWLGPWSDGLFGGGALR
jgi:hypothetical protein